MALSLNKEDMKKLNPKNLWKYIMTGIISFSIGAAIGPSQSEVDALVEGNQEINEKVEQQNLLLNKNTEEIKTLQTENNKLKGKLEEASPFFNLSEEEQEAVLKEIQTKAEAEEQRKKEEAEKAKKAAEAKAAPGAPSMLRWTCKWYCHLKEKHLLAAHQIFQPELNSLFHLA
ncbi:hypothetical protein [Cytobacillus sp. NCCP-133]|uniref:hypothetical protein n=1 Tax=Cytobacillus sp. NCCP-133 TaxID=766848 RepID=UPI00222E82C5|nr:hypothetical protein [Cytobacillus sp. NCCP-133]GLB60325.1 hypothetical protein NCCP133_24570 [Cytobacillus sp. NCCP-133]